MLNLNFYKIRTGIDIRPLTNNGNDESNIRFEQIIQTISQKAEIEYLNPNILTVIEKSPVDLNAYKGNQKTIYILVFGIDKERSAWTASDLKITLGNMSNPFSLIQKNNDAEQWVGGANNNISAEKALFDLRTVKKK